MRRKRADYFNKKLSKISEIKLPLPPKNYFHVYQMYTIRILNGKRNELKQFLTKKGITTKIYFSPIHKSAFYKKLGYSNIKLPVTEKISSQVLTLPFWANMKKSEINFVVKNIEKFFGE